MIVAIAAEVIFHILCHIRLLCEDVIGLNDALVVVTLNIVNFLH